MMKNRKYLIVLLMFGSMTQIYAQGNEKRDSTGFVEFEDYYLFSFRRQIAFKSDTEVYYPTHFDVKLPKEIVEWYLSNSRDFSFLYVDTQVVFISTDIYQIRKPRDTSYAVDSIGVYNLLESEFSNFIDQEFNEYKYLIKKGRMNYVFFKKRSIILLFNVKEENFKYFKDLAGSYREVERETD